MITVDQIRACALSLPEVTEGPPVPAARRIAAFKVAGKSFVGVETGARTMTIALAEDDADDATRDAPRAFEPITRNGKVLGLRVDLSRVTTTRARALIEQSWAHAAPKRLVEARARNTPV